MRQLVFSLCYFLFASTFSSYAQSFSELLQKGKAEFKKEADADYKSAITYLESAVKLNPKSAEAHYYLGYAYDRDNAADGSTMLGSAADKTLSSSAEFELVNKLEPAYKGEKVILDPYTKLTALWGALAMSYMTHQKTDSMKWALKEGKKRGGFGEFPLACSRTILQALQPNSILFSMGDMSTFSLLYVQEIEGIRTDVQVVDLSLLQTSWYPMYLKTAHLVEMSMSDSAIQNIEYTTWSDSSISIPIAGTGNNFDWKMEPTFSGQYVLRGHLVTLDILSANQFKKPVYFIPANIEDYIGLQELLEDQMVVGALNPHGLAFDAGKAMDKMLQNIAKANNNASSEKDWIVSLQYAALKLIYQYVKAEDMTTVKQLIKLYDKYLPERNYPLKSETSEWLNNIRKG